MKFLTLLLAAVMTLTLALPAEAGLTWTEKGIFKSQMLVGKLANCLAKADANVTKGKRVETGPDDNKCVAKYYNAWAKNREKALEKGADEGEDMSACEAATSDAMRDGAGAATLLGANRDLSWFWVDASDLLADAAIQEAVDAAVAGVDITTDNEALCTAAGGTYDSGPDSCTVDITSNDQTVCETAGGSWDSGTCTAVSSYNCTIGAMCSAWAAAYPGELPYYTNNHVGYTATSTGCAVEAWDQNFLNATSYVIFDGSCACSAVCWLCPCCSVTGVCE